VTTEHQRTREEEAYGELFDEILEKLSEPARTLIGEAHSAAYADNMVSSCCFQLGEYEEAMEKMRLAAAELTEREHELLTRLWRAALVAAASIDPNDFETLAGYRVYRGNLHYYWRMFSDMVEKTLQEKYLAELRREGAEREPIDLANPPF
jgi:hypothetical protein